MTRKTAGKNRIVTAVLTAILCIAVFVIFLFESNHSLFNLSVSKNATGEDYVKIIDVGQGDSILIQSDGYSALLDTGPAEGANALSEALYKSGISKIDVLMLSHLHIDHTGGVSRIFEDFSVKNLILPELSTYSEGIYSAQLAINEVTKSGGGVYSAVQGMNFMLGDFEITILASYGKMDDENNRSLIIMAEIDDKKFLFTGDAETKVEKELLKESINVDCDVLKSGHHGSSTSNSKAFLDAATPNYVAISAGKNNMYGHPHKEILAEFKKRGAEVFRTDKNGDITFYIEKGKIIPETEK